MFCGGLEMLDCLLAGTTDEHAGLLAGFDGFDRVAVAKAECLAIKDVIGEVLLKVALGIILQHQSHIADWNERHFCVTEQRVAHAEHEGHFFTFIFNGFDNRFEMVANDFWSVGLIGCGSVEQGILQDLERLAFALEMDCFGGALTEVDRDDTASLTRTQKRGQGPGLFCGNCAQSTRFLFPGAYKLEQYQPRFLASLRRNKAFTDNDLHKTSPYAGRHRGTLL
jgi:hypothetical protein